MSTEYAPATTTANTESSALKEVLRRIGWVTAVGALAVTAGLSTVSAHNANSTFIDSISEAPVSGN